jgi:hypothetical protein
VVVVKKGVEFWAVQGVSEEMARKELDGEKISFTI